MSIPSIESEVFDSWWEGAVAGNEVVDTPESKAAARAAWLARSSTPSSRWQESGKPDPHADRYDEKTQRANLCLGSLTDDELANAVFMCDHRTSLQSISYLTAAKERIRWLSRRVRLLTTRTP